MTKLTTLNKAAIFTRLRCTLLDNLVSAGNEILTHMHIVSKLVHFLLSIVLH